MPKNKLPTPQSNGSKKFDGVKKLSRSKIELFTKCPRCFYLDQVLGIKQPSGPAFSLNSAVDHLLKKEFDAHRAKGIKHPLMKQYKIKAIPYQNDELNDWRNNFRGIRYLHKPSGITFYGAVDDIWINEKGELYVVDYKSTSTAEEIKLEGKWKEAYKRQVEIYQWLLRKNGYKVSDTAYFVYCNGRKDPEAFDGKLEFDVQVIEHKGNDKWVEKTIGELLKCLRSSKIPKADKDCEFCSYFEKRKKIKI